MNASSENRPPRLIAKIIRQFCDRHFWEEVEGDLSELFEENVQEKGLLKAKLLYALDAFYYFRPYFFRKRKNTAYQFNFFAMLKNHFIVYLRNLVRQKTQSIINIFGLALGLASFALISLWVQHELSFDSFHKKADRIYRLAGVVNTDSETFHQAVTSPPFGPQLQQDFPEIEKAVRLDINDAVVKKDNTLIAEEGLVFTDPSFFEVFDFKLLKGNITTALQAPYQIVLSESMAKRYFGDKDPIGETLTMYLYDPGQLGAEYLITGVIEDCPANSHIRYEALGSFSTIEKVDPEINDAQAWFWNGYYTYLLLHEDANLQGLEEKLPAFTEKYMGRLMGEYKIHFNFYLQKLSSLYLDSMLRYEPGLTGSKQSVWIFTMVGVFILLLAIINYVNLSTAVSVKKESLSGIRKVMGARRSHLILQHLSESVFTAMLALILAILFMELVKPLFYEMSGKIGLPFYKLKTLFILLAMALFTGLLAGAYPAIIFSSASPVYSLKKHRQSGKKSASLRKLLVTCQFVVTVFLISGVLMINEQFAFIKEKDLGLDKDNIIVLKVNGSREVVEKYEVFRAQLLQEKQVKSVASSRSTLSNGLSNGLANTVDSTGKQVNSSIYYIRMDENFLSTYGMQLVAGRNLTTSPADSNAVILNQAAIKAFGWKNAEESIGKPFHQFGRSGKVIGVVKNFHYNSLEHPLEPVSLFNNGGNISRISVKFTGNPADALTTIEKYWEKLFPASYFDYQFFDKSVETQYQSTANFSTIFYAFSVICILIACMGLFGLVTFATAQRQKEIGIRKVLGASVSTILWLISVDFLGIIFIAIFVAFPIAWYFMDNWLNQFAYHTTINVWVFLGSGLLVIVIALLSGFVQSLKGALANPVNSLKSE
ncbi:MAG: ABC transporter permease [Bacteroidota bacterium]